MDKLHCISLLIYFTKMPLSLPIYKGDVPTRSRECLSCGACCENDVERFQLQVDRNIPDTAPLQTLEDFLYNPNFKHVPHTVPDGIALLAVFESTRDKLHFLFLVHSFCSK